MQFSVVIRTIPIIVLTLVLGQGALAQAQSKPQTDADNHLTPADTSGGWIALFDGQTMFGWRPTSDADWQVDQGTLKVTGGKKGMLRTTAQFSNFHLSLEFMSDAATNSGIFIRTSPKPKSLKRDCFEVNIAPEENPFPTGGIVGVQKAAEPAPVKEGQWNLMEVVADEGRVTVKVNGSVVNELQTSAESPGRGFIGLQFNSGTIAFKNVFLKPLELTPLLNGKDLNGWDDSQKQASTFSINQDGHLKVISGRGQLESKAVFADFVLQASCKTNAEGLNSGIFFRSIPNEFTNGYESQIQNQFKDDDPTKPVDCGTGGIFRRQNARRVNAQDKEWFTKTIIASGPHISVWVNGLQVTDWTDKRPANANPRKGLRLEAGSIILQGHDPTTDILFGRIDAQELTPRH